MNASAGLEAAGEALGLLLGLGLMSAWIYFQPELSRRDVAFGVHVPTGFRNQPAFQLARRTYRRHVLLHLAIGGAIALASLETDMPLIMALAVIWPTAAGMPIASLAARRVALPFAKASITVREADIGAQARSGLPGGVAAQLGPFVIIGAACAYVAAHWDQVPRRVAHHWDLFGHADGWRMKSGVGFFLPIAVALFICLTSAGGALGILHGAPAGDYRRRNLRGILFGEYLLATLFSWYFVAALFPDDHGATTTLTFAVMLAAVGGAVAFRSAGGTAKAGGRHAGGPPPGRTADGSWKAGMFYFAPSDPAIFVPTRTGIGYTLNFARRWAWAWVALVALTVPLAIVLLGFVSARHR